MAVEKPSLDVKTAIICFQFGERIKSELIIAAKLSEYISGLRGDELVGGEKLISSFFNALSGEIQIAYNVLGMRNFEEANRKVMEAADRVRSHEYLEATRRISEAISFITTSGQRAMQALKENGLL